MAYADILVGLSKSCTRSILFTLIYKR